MPMRIAGAIRTELPAAHRLDVGVIEAALVEDRARESERRREPVDRAEPVFPIGGARGPLQSADPLLQMNAEHGRAAPFDDLEAVLGDEHVAFGGRRCSRGFDRAAGWREQPRQRAAGGGQIEEVAWLQLEFLLQMPRADRFRPDELDGRQASFAHDDRQRCRRLIDRRRRAGRSVAFALHRTLRRHARGPAAPSEADHRCQVETADEVGLREDRQPPRRRRRGESGGGAGASWAKLPRCTAKHQHEGQDHTRGAGGHYV